MPGLLFKTTMAGLRVSTWVLHRVDYFFNDSVVSLQPSDHQDPHAMANILRQRGPILRSYVNRGWIVSGYDEVTQLLRHPQVNSAFADNVFAKRMFQSASGRKHVPFLEYPSLQQVDPPDHTRLRKLVSKGFVQKYIQSLTPTIERVVDTLIEAIPTDQPFDLIEAIARPLPAIVIAEMMGVPVSDRVYFEKWSAELLGLVDLGQPVKIGIGVNADFEMRQYMAGLVEKKRQQPGEDFISELIGAEEDGDKLSLDELMSTAVLLLVAGHETTTRLIGSSTLLLLKHPEQLAKVRTCTTSLENALEEALRFEPPVLFVPRVVKQSFSYKDNKFRDGQILLLGLYAANRDPAKFTHPDEFLIDRDDLTHISFGHGIHLCLGITLARIEGKIVLQKLLQKFPNLAMAEEKPIWQASPMFRGLQQLMLKG